jgi:DNA-binding transcriptional MerR regulator
MSHGQVLCERRHWHWTPARRRHPLSVQPDPAGAPGSEELTVDQLAARVGMTVRNVRAYAARGLLPPPRLRGRTGWYGREHVARLLLVREMLAEGWSLAMIERTLAHAPHTASTTTLALHRALVTPWLPPEPERATAGALAERAGVPEDPELVAELESFGLVERVDDELRVLDPALLAAGLQVVRLGVPPRALLAAQTEVIAHVQEIARTYVAMFLDHGADALVDDALGSTGGGDLDAVGDAVARLQSAAAQALLASFRTAMADAVEEAVGGALAAREGSARGDEPDRERGPGAA